ncbi:hypothetical protein [Thermococcus nautili]|uniref:N-terminal coiled-coil domain protein n=1 Tax=Thermococcus nautili TaxID=195522 RepID=U3RGX8_9EURY|nr:hypothetical protein [Thermococcus nautili]AGX15329.1 N-terminal coiled-coil domain protein [Thermococcus nautili]AHL21654.1 N-terminal coiled-coil domain protein [Thermococcus nautili]
MTGGSAVQSSGRWGYPEDPREWFKQLVGALPATELLEESEILVVDINLIKGILNELQQELEKMSLDELLDKFLSVVPDIASEESYNEAIKKLEKVYKEMFPVEFGMLEKFREHSTLEDKKRVWEEIYRPTAVNLAEGFASESARLWDYAFSKEDISDDELEELDLINRWLFLLTKVFAISSRLEDMEKSVELSRFGIVLYLRGLKILYETPGISIGTAKQMLRQDFELIIRKILESGYDFQKADDYLLSEVLEE